MSEGCGSCVLEPNRTGSQSLTPQEVGGRNRPFTQFLHIGDPFKESVK